MAFPTIHEPKLVGRTAYPASPRASCSDLIGHCRRGRGHAGSCRSYPSRGSRRRWRCSYPRSRQRQRGCSPTSRGAQRARNARRRGDPATIARMWRAPRPRTGSGRWHRSGASPRRDGAERPSLAGGRARRATGRPGRAPGRHLRHTQRRRLRPARPRDLGRPRPSRRSLGPPRAAPYSSGAMKRGTPAVPDGRRPTPGGRARYPQPQGDGRRWRVLHVGGGLHLRAGPGPSQLGDALVHEPAAPVEVDAGLHVLRLVATHAETEDEASTGEELESGRLLGHGGDGSQGQLQDARAQQRPSGRDGGHGQRGESLADGLGPVEVVHGLVSPPPSDLQQRRHGSISSALTEYAYGYYQPRGRVLLRGGRRMNPSGSGRSTSCTGVTPTY